MKEAIDRGLIDSNTGMYRDPRTGKLIPITEAARMGLVVADVTTDLNLNISSLPGTLSQDITSVFDPVTGKQVR